MPDILDFLGGAAHGGLEEWQKQRALSSQEEKERRREYLRLLMSGDFTEPEAREISGYKGVTGRETQVVESATRRAGEEKQAEERKKLMKEGEKYTALPVKTATELGMPIDYTKVSLEDRATPRVPVRMEEARLFESLRPGETPEEKARAAGLRETAVQEARLPFKEPMVSEEEAETKKAKLAHAKRVQSAVDKFNADFRKEVIGRYLKLSKERRQEKRVELWQAWQESIGSDIREDVAKKLKMPLGELIERATPEENIQKDIYNSCRDKGGDHEECLRQAGVTINK